MPDKPALSTRPLIIFVALGLLAPMFVLSIPTRTYATFDPAETETAAAITPEAATEAATETELPTSTPTATPKVVQIASLAPASVGNAASSTITVTGSGFASGAVVVLENTSTLSTTFVSSTVLTATIPAGVAGGLYDVRVINPDSSTSLLADGLKITNQIKSTKTPEPTATIKPTTFARPVITVVSYTSSATTAYPGQDVDFEITIQNTGEIGARDLTVTVSSDDLVPRETGGLISLDTLRVGDTVTFSQPMRVSGDLTGTDAVASLAFRYFDKYGNDYSDTAVIGVRAKQYAATPTPTPTLVVLSQLALTNYQTTPTDLTPGTEFTLAMDVSNVSSQVARQVIVNLGISEANADVVNLKNSGSTRFIEELQPGKSAHLEFNMVVSGSASGQLVPVTLGLTYMDSGNTQQTQTEAISLQINSTPFLLIHYLTAPGPIKVGETADISVEVINIGTSSLNVSTIEVVSDELTISDGSLYVGPLDSSTSGTVAAQATGETAGTATVSVIVHYLDDNQQEQTATQELTLEVEADPTPTPAASGQGASSQSSSDSQTVLGRVWKAALAFFGLSIRTGGPQGGAGGPNGQPAPAATAAPAS